MLSNDPPGYLGSGTNYYTYVGNRPVSATDPLGLSAIPEGAKSDGASAVTAQAARRIIAAENRYEDIKKTVDLIRVAIQHIRANPDSAWKAKKLLELTARLEKEELVLYRLLAILVG